MRTQTTWLSRATGCLDTGLSQEGKKKKTPLYLSLEEGALHQAPLGGERLGR